MAETRVMKSTHGGPGRGQGRRPTVKLYHKQAARVAGLWGYAPGRADESWRTAEITTHRATPNRFYLAIADGYVTIRLIVDVEPRRRNVRRAEKINRDSGVEALAPTPED